MIRITITEQEQEQLHDIMGEWVEHRWAQWTDPNVPPDQKHAEDYWQLANRAEKARQQFRPNHRSLTPLLWSKEAAEVLAAIEGRAEFDHIRQQLTAPD